MENEKKKILIPWDFSQVAEYALQHAVKLVNYIDNDIELLHVVESTLFASPDKNKMLEAEQKLKVVAASVEKNHNIKTYATIIDGSIFNVISDYASNNNISMVIMGTHGMKGMQKITGSWALKVIVGSTVPFIVVQSPPEQEVQFKNIIFPVNFDIENKEKLSWAIFLNRLFDSKISIIKPKITDSLLKKKLNINMLFAKKNLAKHEIDFNVYEADKSNFAKETLRYATELNADLILIMSTKNINSIDYVLGASEQYIIANALKIPVMVVNPRTDLKILQLYGA